MTQRKVVIFLISILIISITIYCFLSPTQDGKERATKSCFDLASKIYNWDGKARMTVDTAFAITKSDISNGIVTDEYVNHTVFYVSVTARGEKFSERGVVCYCDGNGGVLNERDYESENTHTPEDVQK